MQNDTQLTQAAREPSPQFNAPAPRPLQSGSCVLDRMFARSGLQSGQPLHLYGGYRAVQQQLALLMCKAVCERGERALFLNLGEPIERETLDRLGLWPFSSTDPTLDLRQRFLQPFRLWTAKSTCGQSLEEPLHEILGQIKTSCMSAGFNGQRLTLVVDNLERAFEPSTTRLSPVDAYIAQVNIEHWLHEISLLCRETGATVWLLHSGDEAAPRLGRGTDADTRWRHPLDLNERGELIRRAKKKCLRRQAQSGQALAPSPFQRAVTRMLCGEASDKKASDASAREDEGEEIPTLFGLEVSYPGMLFSSRGFGGTRFAFLVQLWRGRGRAGELERLLLHPTYRFDNNPDRWTPPLRPSLNKFLRSLPTYLGTTAGDGSDAFQGTETNEDGEVNIDKGSMRLGTPRLALKK